MHLQCGTRGQFNYCGTQVGAVEMCSAECIIIMSVRPTVDRTPPCHVLTTANAPTCRELADNSTTSYPFVCHESDARQREVPPHMGSILFGNKTQNGHRQFLAGDQQTPPVSYTHLTLPTIYSV